MQSKAQIESGENNDLGSVWECETVRKRTRKAAPNRGPGRRAGWEKGLGFQRRVQKARLTE